MKKCGVNLTSFFFGGGHFSSNMLVTGGIETNPGVEIGMLMERLLDHMMPQRKEGTKKQKLLKKTKTSMKILQNCKRIWQQNKSRQSAKTMYEQEGIKNPVNRWEVTQKKQKRN
jgi:hypothetical protein